MMMPKKDDTTGRAKKKRSPYPQSFWIANTMEIFERLAWYGWFAVSSLYITGSVSEGALGFSSEQRGVLQGIVPFILYLLPVLFGALADRFGYKKTFIIAYSSLVPAYYLLGQFTSFAGFFMAFLFVAVGAAIFKPVIVGTVARTTDETNASMGFGIFYMMVNVGGFIGPMVAGFVRVRYGWDFVFIASSFWIACNFIWLLLFYKEPTTEAGTKGARTIRQVLGGLVEVLGNGRFFILIFGILLLLMVAGGRFSWTAMGLFTVGWIGFNFLLDIWFRHRQKVGHTPKGLARPMKLGNWPFALYLLILSGFWTSFNQIFLTAPEYIRDFVETRDMIDWTKNTCKTIGKPEWGDKIVSVLAAVNEEQLSRQLGHYVTEHATTVPNRIQALDDGTYISAYDPATRALHVQSGNPVALGLQREGVEPFVKELYHFKVRIPPEVLAHRLSTLPLETFVADSSRLADFARQLQSGPKLTKERVDTLVARFLHQGLLHRHPVAAEKSEVLRRLAQDYGTILSKDAVRQIDSLLLVKGQAMNTDQLLYLFGGLVYPSPVKLALLSHEFAEGYRQVNPEYMINFDAGAIVVFQVLISFFIGFLPPLTAMVIGIVVAAIGIGMCAFFTTGWAVVLAIVIFAFGEMMASPKSQEYVGRIAPAQKVAMFMGYYFWTVALGNIFGGRLSGELYGTLARDMNRPDIMWIIFGVVGLATAVILVGYDWLVIRRHEKAGKEHPMSRTMSN
ncbi:MAG: MFS transporter [bacterium]